MTQLFATNMRRLSVIAMAASCLLHGQGPASQNADQSSVTKPAGQSSSTSPEQAKREASLRRFSFGAQVRWWPSQPVYARSYEVDNTQANTGATFATSPSSGRFGLGPVVDMNLTNQWSLRLEALFQHLEYTKTTAQYTGGGSSSGTLGKTFTEHTRTGFWDIPFVAQYHRLPPSSATTSVSSTSSQSAERWSRLSPRSIFGHMFFEGGGILRQLTTVRSGNDTLNPDNTTAYNETPATPKNRTVIGAVVGTGLRLVDDFNLKVMPEVRYIFWMSPSFQLDSTQSRTRQIEVDLSIVF